MADFYQRIRPLLFWIDPETAHKITIWALNKGWVPAAKFLPAKSLEIRLWNMPFPHPLGLAAGFDKHLEVPGPLHELGFAFTEMGTITPQPQPGNPKPRIFRLVEQEAVINRFGFNSEGAGKAYERLQSIIQRGELPGGSIVGINIGKNKTTIHAEGDYVALLQRFHDQADYITVNISSPNTEGLRDLQNREKLDELLSILMREKASLERTRRRKPLLLKISPDENEDSLATIAELALWHQLDGLIVSNTTVSRSDVPERYREVNGGLSGKPLMPLATQALHHLYRFTEGKMPLVGVGGISSADDAWEKIRAGAVLLQLYTAFIYQGPKVIADIVKGLERKLREHGFTHLMEAVGTAHPDIKPQYPEWTL
ncbi:quinone-dependent dihydroorotate dehydrogenase [bacterium]|nr:quinone-dependent dihydroorotate dehydrogenase [bacterium]